ncbi:MAG: cyclic nucleotide-binding domain-containing protein [Lysobacterales bacterium]|jgi:ABC-type multidrug transport system fused ATPase/permease subunit
MEKGIFRFILRFSLREQIILVLMSAAALPLLYFTLELPKTIVNQAISGTDFPRQVLGMEFEQIPYLLLLCGLFLLLVLLSGAMKYFTSTFRYRVGDRLLRRLRYSLIERLLRFPSSEFRNLSSGQVVSMITAETSNLGYFIAEAFAVPAIALGTLATIVLFMFIQNWMMGVAAIALYPLQIYLIPKLQRRVNALQRQEVQTMREISQRIGDVVAGASEIHGHDTAQYELAHFSNRLGTVFGYRVEMSSKRYIANVLNQIFSQLTPFFFLSIGGYLVIIGDLSLGSLVAVLAAYKDMYAPWKDLIDYYQKSEDAKVRYDQLREFFARNNLLEKSVIESDPGLHDFIEKPLVASNVVIEQEEGHRPVNGATLNLTLPTHTVILGSAGSGREEFARLLARQETPHSGKVLVGDIDLSALPDSVTGRKIGYVTHHTHLASGSLRDVLVYPLLRNPGHKAGEEGKVPAEVARAIAESRRAGNSAYDLSADWIDYEAAGCRDAKELCSRMVRVLWTVELDDEVYEIGLRHSIDPEEQPELPARLIEARRAFRSRLEAEQKQALVEAFDPERYNANASVAENILFGTPAGPEFAIRNLGQNPYVREVIERAGLTHTFLEMGRKLASLKSEIFRDLPPGHEFLERFSFIGARDLPAFESILRRAEAQGLDSLPVADCERLMALPFRLVEAQDHEGLIDQGIKERLLDARRLFADNLPDDAKRSIQFFDIDTYNAASTIADNILFGKIASTRAGSAAQIGGLISEVVEELDLREAVILAGLEYQIGTGGARLTAAQRQKLAVARCLLKRPEILILNEALSSLETAAQDRVLSRIKDEMEGRSLILFEPHEERKREFAKILVMDKGRIVDKETSETGQAHQPASAAAGALETGEESRVPRLNEITSVLMDIPLFAGIGRSKLKLLAYTSERVHFEAGEEVFHQGDTGDHAYVILEGEAEVVLESEGGSSTVATLGRNELFGEMALLANMPRTTTIRARTPMVLLSMSQDIFMRMVAENSEIAIAMMRVITERLASTLRDYGKAITFRENAPTG